MIEPSFWAGKTVLVTGHTGFKGGWLSLWLSQLGANVHGYALDPITDPNLYTLTGLSEIVDSHIEDIRNKDALQKTLTAVQPEIVFHLAAQPLVRESYRTPAETIEVNVIGTMNILDSIRQCDSVKAAVVVTSDKCYQNREWHWGYRENESLGGHDPYSASKACAELITHSWRQSFLGEHGLDRQNCAVATARAGNVIGGGDWSDDRLIPDLLASIDEGSNIVLRNPGAIRPWQHVLEPLAGYLLLAQHLAADGQRWAQAWNFGPADSDAKSVSWIVEQLIKLFKSPAHWQSDTQHQPHEARHLKLDCSKAREQLGWQTVWTLQTCLEEIVRWHLAWRDGSDMQRISLNTIEKFTSCLDSLYAASTSGKSS